MKLSVRGIGARGPGFADWSQLQSLLRNPPAQALPATGAPVPALIPARERRRAPLLARLAVDVAGQACAAARVAPESAAAVFASGLGDMAITDYMCRVLAGADQAISPTRFHNSVHNAAAGYWSIAAACREASNSISASGLTASAAMLEAATHCAGEDRPVLLVVFDVPGPAPLGEIWRVSDAFAVALVLQAGTGHSNLDIEVRPGAGAWPALGCGDLCELYESNPAARMLAILDCLGRQAAGTLALPLGRGTELAVTIRGARCAA